MRSRASHTTIATGLVLAAAVVMAVIAVVAFADRTHTVRLTRRELGVVSRLAVLRRPQQAADRSIDFSGPIVAGLTREVATLPGNWGLGPVHIFMVVGQRGRVSLLTVYGKRTLGLAEMAPARLDNPRAVASGLIYTIGVVPDGVTSVRWIFRSLAHARGKPVKLVIHPMVRNNVAIAPVIGRPRRLVSATWYGQGGRPVRP
jgi:hypothetical protein